MKLNLQTDYDNFKKREIRKETKEENKILTQKCIMLY